MTKSSLGKRGLVVVGAAVAELVMVTSAAATTLAGGLTADNEFSLYLSNDDSTLGVLQVSGASWGTTYALSPTALSGGTVYLHVVATDWGAPAGFIGDFSLGDAGYAFANGTQSLLTDTAHWTVRTGSFAGADETPISLGANGVGPWGTRSGISGSAQWIWDADTCGSCTRYFSTTIASAVPEPATIGLLLAGLGVVATASGRRQRAS